MRLLWPNQVGELEVRLSPDLFELQGRLRRFAARESDLLPEDGGQEFVVVVVDDLLHHDIVELFVLYLEVEAPLDDVLDSICTHLLLHVFLKLHDLVHPIQLKVVKQLEVIFVVGKVFRHKGLEFCLDFEAVLLRFLVQRAHIDLVLMGLEHLNNAVPHFLLIYHGRLLGENSNFLVVFSTAPGLRQRSFLLLLVLS